jgi:hypothetical protein
MWYRELFRSFDHTMRCQPGDDDNGYGDRGGGVSGMYAMALVAPLKRLRILGAPPSVFAVPQPASLKIALDAHAEDDFKLCEELTLELLRDGKIPEADKPKAEQLVSLVRELRRIENPTPPKRIPVRIPQLKKSAPPEVEGTWICLVSEGPEGRDKNSLGKVSTDEATKWRIKVVESDASSPAGWAAPDFDESNWPQTTLPISWHLNHRALLRGKFMVEDGHSFSALRMRLWMFRQEGIRVYVNGKLIATIDNLGSGEYRIVTVPLEPSALGALEDGENTIAVSSRNMWCWGGIYWRAYNDGFGFRLDALKKE